MKTNPSLAAFIITFNRPLILKDTLQQIMEQTRPPDLILVVDNGRSSDTEDITRQFSEETVEVKYQAMDDNIGPAGAAAYALQWLCDQGYDWICWVDDDNPLRTPDTLERLLKLGVSSTDENLGGVAAVGALWDWKKGELKRVPDPDPDSVVEVDAVGGNQQLILRREVIQAVGLPDARLFFGLEEIEYCLRIRRAGYHLLVDGGLMQAKRAMFDRLNMKQPRLTAAALQKNYSSLWRRYYTTRNYIFTMNETFQRPDLARRETLKSFARAFFSWARGPKYGAAFCNLQMRGVVDGYLGRMGRTVMPNAKYKDVS